LRDEACHGIRNFAHSARAFIRVSLAVESRNRRRWRVWQRGPERAIASDGQRVRPKEASNDEPEG
ncbi:MAG: hypothetical protein VCC04_09140, partial [Myxococcota bacterium]